MRRVLILSEALDKWHKRWSKKGPLFIYKTKVHLYGGVTESMKEWRERQGHTEHPEWQTGKLYRVMYRDDEKVKYSIFNDGMSARYGAATIATLKGPSISYLWQSNAGSVNVDEINSMIHLYNTGTIYHEDVFTTTMLKGIKW